MRCLQEHISPPVAVLSGRQFPTRWLMKSSSAVAVLAGVDYGPRWDRAAALECRCWIGRVDEAHLPMEGFFHTTAT